MIKKIAFSLLCGTLSFFHSPARAEGLASLPTLSQALIHHFQCKLMASTGSGAPDAVQEREISLSPFENRRTLTLSIEDSVITATFQTQSLDINWTRAGRVVVQSQMVMQETQTLAFVLIAQDPTNADAFANLSCSAVSFADQKAHSQKRLLRGLK